MKMDDTETILAEVPSRGNSSHRTHFRCGRGRHPDRAINDAVSLTATDPGSRLNGGGAGFVIEEGTMGSEALTAFN